MSHDRPRPGHDDFLDVDNFVADLESKEESELADDTEIREGDEYDYEDDGDLASSIDDSGVSELDFEADYY